MKYFLLLFPLLLCFDFFFKGPVLWALVSLGLFLTWITKRMRFFFKGSAVRSRYNSFFSVIIRCCLDFLSPLKCPQVCANWCRACLPQGAAEEYPLELRVPSLCTHWHLSSAAQQSIPLGSPRPQGMVPIESQFQHTACKVQLQGKDTKARRGFCTWPSPSSSKPRILMCVKSEASPAAGDTPQPRPNRTLDKVVLPQEKIMPLFVLWGTIFGLLRALVLQNKLEYQHLLNKYWLWELQAKETCSTLSVVNNSRS